MSTSLLLAALVAGGTDGSPATPPTYLFKVRKENAVAAAEEKDRTIFLVTNPFGIGEATIKLKDGRWPDRVVLRFQYKNEKGEGFTNLEHIRVTTDRIYTEGSLKQSGDFPFFFLDAKGQKPFEVIDDRRASGRLKVLVEQRDGAVEVTLPAHLVAGSGQIHVYWIDAYRR